MPSTRSKPDKMAENATMEVAENRMETNQEIILNVIRMLKTELLSKIDEKAEVQATEIKTQCEQLREEFGSMMGQAAARIATI